MKTNHENFNYTNDNVIQYAIDNDYLLNGMEAAKCEDINQYRDWNFFNHIKDLTEFMMYCQKNDGKNIVEILQEYFDIDNDTAYSIVYLVMENNKDV